MARLWTCSAEPALLPARAANDPHQGRQNEANEGHGQGPPVKQCHAKQRQAENHKFHGCASAAVASENKDR
jgi:hypothetical protein